MGQRRTVIRGGTLVDGSGLPMRRADVAICDGVISEIGRLARGDEVVDADGLVVMPGIVDHHTHYDPQLTFDPFATSSCFHGVTSVVTGNCGFSIAPCAEADRDFLTGFFAAVEGMSRSVLEEGLRWTWDGFGSYLDALEGRLGVNAAVYVGHTSVRRAVLGEAASERAASEPELDAMRRLVEEAMAAGAAGFSSTQLAVDRDQFGRLVPSAHAGPEELVALAEVAGRSGRGSIAFLPGSVIEGLSAGDAELILELGRRSGLPVITQGLGGRPGRQEDWEARWADDRGFLARARQAGCAVYVTSRVQPFVRPFTWRRGTSQFAGAFHWRDLPMLSHEERLERMRHPGRRKDFRKGWDQPNTDAALGSTLLPPPPSTVFVQRSGSHPELEGLALTEIAAQQGVHPADVMCDLTVADDLDTVFLWKSENDAWLEGTAQLQESPHVLVGTGDGGAHADRDDGSEWSTYFLQTWVLERQQCTLEEGVRRITHLPAQVCGLARRGLIAPGYFGDVVLFDPQRLKLSGKRLVQDLPGGGERWRAEVEGIVRVLVNGETIVRDGRLQEALPGRVLRPGAGP